MRNPINTYDLYESAKDLKRSAGDLTEDSSLQALEYLRREARDFTKQITATIAKVKQIYPVVK